MSLETGKLVPAEPSSGLFVKPLSSHEIMCSTRQVAGIRFGEPRPIPKPIEVIGKGKDVVIDHDEDIFEATCIVNLMMDQANIIAAEKIEIFDTWVLNRMSIKYDGVIKGKRHNQTMVKARQQLEESLEMPIRTNFNPLQKSAKAEEKALKRLDEIMEDYISVVTRYVHGASCSGVSPFESSSNEDEIMDLSDDCNVDEDEQADALLIEMRIFSVEEKRLMAQPIMEKIVEPVQTNPSIEEEEGVQEPVQALVAQEKEVVEEPVQAPISREEEVLESLILETKASQEKEAEVRKLSDIVHKVCEVVSEEEKEKSKSDLERDEPEKSMQVHTHIIPIQTVQADSQEISSNEGSSVEGTKLIKSMSTLMATLQKNVVEMGSNMVKIMKTQKEDKKEFADLHKTHKEMEQTLKKNTYEVHMVNKTYSKFEKNLFKRQSELLDIERAINVDLQREVVAEKEKNHITQGEDYSRRRGGGVLTRTKSKRKPTSDDSDGPSKRGGGRNGDCGGRSTSGDCCGRSTSGDRGGRSTSGDRGGRKTSGDRGVRSTRGDRGGQSGGTGRGGRSLPPFHNLLTGEELSYEGSRFPIDPTIKREEQ
ncbi:keratin, type I cytoskeletal 9-like [Impatiens glandulifera]|uniref:keratin, type I cytoskeletal 9-like n=1 Tax=Impatiens glandulifera TaxID=253017 RepID=UPI001FB0BDD3|nr:keratin, type I cytoskeletal 9-like [Impatiens glandulifera]